MPKIQETTTVTIEDKSYNVADLPENIQQSIALMDEWRQKDVDLSGEITMVRCAIRDIQNGLFAAIKSGVESEAAGTDQPQQ